MPILIAPPVPDRLPFLEAVCWQTADIHRMSPDEMLSRYERGWQYRGVLADIDAEEERFIHRLALAGGSWLVNDVRP